MADSHFDSQIRVFFFLQTACMEEQKSILSFNKFAMGSPHSLFTHDSECRTILNHQIYKSHSKTQKLSTSAELLFHDVSERYPSLLQVFFLWHFPISLLFHLPVVAHFVLPRKS